jgi:hypothetical protein
MESRSGELSLAELYAIIRSQIEHSNLSMFSPGMMPLVFTAAWLVVLGRLIIAWW